MEANITLEEIVSGQLKTRMRQAAQKIASEWSSIARMRLRTSRKAYIDAITIKEVSHGKVVVGLREADSGDPNSMLANMVEFGMGRGGIGTQGSYDIRNVLLRQGTKGLKNGPDGPYVVIPMAMRGAKSDAPGPQEIERLGGRSALLAARKLTGRVRGTSKG